MSSQVRLRGCGLSAVASRPWLASSSAIFCSASGFWDSRYRVQAIVCADVSNPAQARLGSACLERQVLEDSTAMMKNTDTRDCTRQNERHGRELRLGFMSSKD